MLFVSQPASIHTLDHLTLKKHSRCHRLCGRTYQQFQEVAIAPSVLLIKEIRVRF